MTKAIYAGCFDPFTMGHLDIVKRSMKFCKQLVIAIGYNPAKKTMFDSSQRVDLINKVVDAELNFLDATNIKVDIFEGLLVEYAKQVGADILIRGIRSVSDFEYEINLANINKTLAPNIETVFLPTSPELGVVSSSAVKEIAKYGGDISKFVPPYVAEVLKDQFGFVKYGETAK
jgi:pantetheine-phosphate adenylyltransferase